MKSRNIHESHRHHPATPQSHNVLTSCRLPSLSMIGTGQEPPPKVLVPEKLSPDGLALLRASLEVDERRGLDADELLQIIPEYEALVVRSETKVTANLLRDRKSVV
ncbi:D 3 phosphoglycerate dehydrogenase [Aspergillus fumigatus]|nr:D 3 phosphoglycerate dehydrogenase [Aspergillus fumigatus]